METIIVQRIGDVNPILYGGGVVLQNEHGDLIEYTYGLEAEFCDRMVAECREQDPEQTLKVYQCYVENDVFKYYDWASPKKIAAQYEDLDHHDLIVMGRSKKRDDRVFCITEIGNLEGWINLDNEPNEHTIGYLNKRWQLSNG